MAVAFDAVGPSSAGAHSATSPCTWTHVAGGSATAVLVGVAVDSTADGAVTCSATFGGNAMTSVLRWESGGSAQSAGFVQVFSLLSPPTGSQTVSVSTSGGTVDSICGGSISFTGAGSFSSAVHSDSGGVVATSGSLAVPTGSVNSMAATFICDGSDTIAWTAGTGQFTFNGTASAAAGACSGATAAGTGGSVSFTWTQTSDFYAAVGIEVQAASTGVGLPLIPMLTRHPGRVFRNKYQKQRQYQQLDRIGPVVQTPFPETGPAVITSLANPTPGVPVDAAYFLDQYGNPRLWFCDNPWSLLPNAGRWNGSGGSTWQNDLDNYCNSRGSQGFTGVYLDPLGNTENGGAFADGRTWDGVFPFLVNGTAGTVATGTETVALNDPFWQRVDYLLTACARNGMVLVLNAAYTGQGDFATGAAYVNFTAAQFTAVGTALGQRYGASPGVQWLVGNDYQGTAFDALFTALLNGLRAGGSLPQNNSIHYSAEMTARRTCDTSAAQPWGEAHAQFNFVYTYQPTYFCVEYAYTETSHGESALLPVVWGDGYFYQGNGAQFELGMRQMAWWALSSGARGCNTGSEGIWQWPSTAPAAVTSENWFNAQAGVAISLVSSLAGWWNLIPDTGNVFITAGRGTRTSGTTSGGSGAKYGDATTDTYVSGSITPDGTLALIYFSEGAHSNTITVNQSLLVPGYSATWVDPVSGSKTAAVTGSTYTPPAAVNAGGTYHDRVLVLGPSLTAAAAAGTVPVVAPGAATVQAANW